MEKVLGIGGLFFRSENPDGLAEWYATHLGINTSPKAAGDEPWQQQAGTTAFSPFKKDTEYFGRPSQMWMINFRVANMDAMVEQLRVAGIAVELDPETYPWGRFARLHDPEGNPIELWQE